MQDIKQRRFAIYALLTIGALVIGCVIWLLQNYGMLLNEIAFRTVNTFGTEEIRVTIDAPQPGSPVESVRTCMRDVFCGEGAGINLKLNGQTAHTFVLKEYILCAPGLPWRVGKNRVTLTRTPNPNSQSACGPVKATAWFHMSSRYGSTRAYGVQIDEGESVSADVNLVIRDQSE